MFTVFANLEDLEFISKVNGVIFNRFPPGFEGGDWNYSKRSFAGVPLSRNPSR
jgi:hypothetical protein